MKPKRRLKRLRVTEISLVDRPAFDAARPIIMKAAAALDGIAYTGKPQHEWLYVEGIAGGDDLSALVTGIVLQAGDPKDDGGEWTAAQVQRLFRVWAGMMGHDQRWGFICNPDGSIAHDHADSILTAWGLTDGPGLVLHGTDGKALPANCWWTQWVVNNEVARKLIGSKRSVNGLKLLRPVVLDKSAGQTYTLDELAEQLADGIAGRITNLDEYDTLVYGPVVVASDLADDLSKAIADALEDADRETVTPTDLGKELGRVAIDTIKEAVEP